MSVENEPPGGHSLQVEVAVASGAESAAARPSAEAELRTLISNFAPTHRQLIDAMRQRLRARLPAAHEIVYEYRDFFVISYSPNEHGYEGVLAIHAGANGVKLYFNRGKELPDPERLLQGYGNQTGPRGHSEWCRPHPQPRRPSCVPQATMVRRRYSDRTKLSSGPPMRCFAYSSNSACRPSMAGKYALGGVTESASQHEPRPRPPLLRYVEAPNSN